MSSKSKTSTPGGQPPPNNHQRISLLERQVEGLAKSLVQLINQINEAMKALDQQAQAEGQRISGIEEVLRALVTLGPGDQAVADQIQKQDLEQAKADSERSRKTLERQLAEGKAVEVASVGPESFVVFHEEDAAGVVREPGWMCLPLSGFIAEAQPLLLGRAAGDRVQIKEVVVYIKSVVEAVKTPPAEKETAA